MNCFTAKACGRWLPLLYITLQGCSSFRHLSFHSFHCQPPASATHARVFPFIPLRSGHPAVSFRSPLAFPPTTRNSKPKREATFTPLNSLHCIQSPHLLFPMPTSGMSCKVFTPENQEPQNSPPPFNGAGKIKSIIARPSCLQPVRLTHSTVRWDARTSRHRSLFHFVHLTSFSTARVSVSCLTPTPFPPTPPAFQLIFTCDIIYPIKPVPDHYRFVLPSLIVSSCY